MLCVVLLERFLQTPALLALANHAGARPLRPPTVAICPTADHAAQILGTRLSLNMEQVYFLRPLLYDILRGERLDDDRIAPFEELLEHHNLTLREAIQKTGPNCSELLTVCQWRKEVVPCSSLFRNMLNTKWGACCVAADENFRFDETAAGSKSKLIDSELNLVIECSDGTIENSCEFYTQYHGEEWVFPIPITIGHEYTANVRATAIEDPASERLIPSTACVSKPNYLRRRCLVQCKEQRCGCSDPLRMIQPEEKTVPPPCPLRRLNCLRSFKLIEESCGCETSCTKTTSVTVLESSPLNQLQNSLSPIYMHLNESRSIVLTLRVLASKSRVYKLHYTETWWSLLSSVGGVFNMFLGVGIFSFLELVFLGVVKLPAAIRRSNELQAPRM